jgi:hypothetical protein
LDNSPGLLRFEHLARLLELRELALFVGEGFAQLSSAGFLLADLFEDDLDRSFFDPRLTARGCCGCGRRALRCARGGLSG